MVISQQRGGLNCYRQGDDITAALSLNLISVQNIVKISHNTNCARDNNNYQHFLQQTLFLKGRILCLHDQLSDKKRGGIPALKDLHTVTT